MGSSSWGMGSGSWLLIDRLRFGREGFRSRLIPGRLPFRRLTGRISSIYKGIMSGWARGAAS